MAYLQHAELWVSHGQQTRPASVIADEAQQWQEGVVNSPQLAAQPASMQASAQGEKKTDKLQEEHINSLQKALGLIQR